MESMTGIRYAGEYDLLELKLFTSSGAVINLVNMYQSLNIFENMFSNTLSGELLMIDKNNLVIMMSIVGQEFLSFKIKTTGLESNPIDFTEHFM